MYRLLMAMMAALLFAAPVAAQDSDPEFDTRIEGLEDDTAAEENVEPEEPEEPEFDETGLDVQGFEDLDDDFRPSEEIPADQSIEFPTDI